MLPVCVTNSTLKTEAVRYSETSVNLYQITRLIATAVTTSTLIIPSISAVTITAMARSPWHQFHLILSRFSVLHGSHYLIKTLLYLSVALSSIRAWTSPKHGQSLHSSKWTIYDNHSNFSWICSSHRGDFQVSGRFGQTYRLHRQSWGVSQERKRDETGSLTFRSWGSRRYVTPKQVQPGS
jgi:hypothetical protein